ncbi:MAG: InlB B-repeat-containing protein [Prevotellaceae bacterium]|nr:InlB B-repeat-containing protein [Prevotellaceae bacterium]
MRLKSASTTAKNYMLSGENHAQSNQTIKKATPTPAHLLFKLDSTVKYDAQPHSVPVALNTAKYSGMGQITVKYNAKTALPRDTGEYVVTVDIAEGANFLPTRLYPGTFTIDTFYHTLTFNCRGCPKNSIKVLHGDTAPKPPTTPPAILLCYSFGGWANRAHPDPDSSVEWIFGTNTITQDTNLYPRWILDTIKVVFVFGNGDKNDTSKVPCGEVASAPQAPTRQGYTFAKWEDSQQREWIFDDNAITQDTTLIAKWIVDTFKVVFVKDNGDQNDTLKITYDDTVPRPATPIKEGYSFAGWYREAAHNHQWTFPTDRVTHDTTLYAKWITDGTTTYTVTFNSHGGSAIDKQTVEANDTIAHPDNPTKAGHTFDKWTDVHGNEWNFGASTITQDTTLHATWIIDTFSVVFVKNNGDQNDTARVTYGGKVAAPTNPTKAGHTFDAWTDAHGSEWIFGASTVAHDTTLHATWTVNTYKVVFVPDNGSQNDTVTVAYGGKVAAPTNPTKTGHTFDKWTDAQGNEWSFGASTVAHDTTLHAAWIAKRYSVAFVSNGGSAVDTVTVAYGDTVPRPNDPTKANVKFGGWYGDAELSMLWYFHSSRVASDTTLYAQWLDENLPYHTVTFISDSNRIGSQLVTEGETVVHPANPTKAGHTLVGWVDALGSRWDFGAGTVSQDTTLYATWIIDTFRVVFVSNGGSAVDAVPVIYGATVPRPQNPTQAGHTFGRWVDALGSSWDFGASTVAHDTTLYATWTADTFRVAFVSFDGSIVDTMEVVEVSYGGTVPYPGNPSKEGAKFGGWYVNPELSMLWDFRYSLVTSDTTLYAQWFGENKTIHLVIFISDSTIIGSQYVAEGDTIVRPRNPVKADHHFNGWEDAHGSSWEFGASMLSCDTTLYAKWRSSAIQIDSVIINGVAQKIGGNVIHYIAPCGEDVQDIWVSFTLPPDLTSSLPGDTLHVKVERPSFLLDTLITIYSNEQAKDYTLRLEKRFEAHRMIYSQLGGRLLMTVKNPSNNGDFHFRQAEWWSVKNGEEIRADGASGNFYYVLQPDQPKDTMFVMLQESDGTWHTTCLYYPPITAAQEASLSVTVYLNPVATGGAIRIKSDVLTDAELAERYATFRLLNSQGQLASSGSAAILQQGLTMPDIPGAYYLILEGKAGRKVIPIVVGEGKTKS